MFHVKHYSVLSQFYNKNCSNLLEFELESLIDLIYSNKNKKIIFYDDRLYTQIIDYANLSWEKDQVLILSPQDNSTELSPAGFNANNLYSIEYFTKIYSALREDVYAILCAQSQKNITINRDQYNVFTINQDTEYDSLISLCEDKYEKVELVDGPGQYAKRGGIVDIYPFDASHPKRISFLNTLTVMKDFNIDTQRTSGVVPEIKIATLQKKRNLKETLLTDCKGWEQYNIDQKCLVINNDTNNKTIHFPFKSLVYSEFKKIKNQYQVSYENVKRLNGFVYQKQIIAPEWFRTPPKNISENNMLDVTSINIGDFVVHRDHGVGKFIDFRVSENHKQESMIIQYLDNGNLIVDIAHLDKITFYAAKDDNVQLDSLSKPGAWKRRKNNAQKNVQNIVNKLVNAYVNRENAYRSPILPVKDENKFIEEFQHIETPDQIKCWDDIQHDLSLNVPMDRLICGDVGFGKTEIAMRAAYRYITNDKKVIVLAPTTILSEQLYQSFYNRMNNHGIIIDRISRLRTKSDIKNIQDLWINNKLDIVIGTHAVLYNELYLNHADLLIIDEEHRFGVKQKEKIKELNPSIDILTMSATPIPRTLNMALSGMKQISTLASPPKDRKPIITNIHYFNDQLIINSVNNEIIRNGQVYFVHNNVKTIDSIVGFLEEKMPYLSISYIHGQMDVKKIEKRMALFTNKQINVLVCTSIIENGIDISNVNTIIVNNAHKFGLSQLYQIRGRVGRANKQAYALLLIPNQFRLNHDSRLRLKAIEKYTSLGSGYKISNMDLTIRGGGSMFGYDQSGNIESVGYELVSKFINEYMENSSELDLKKTIHTKVNLIDKGIIPTSYIVSTKIRLLFYRKIKATQTLEEIVDILDEMDDRFGKIPKDLLKIIEIQKISVLAQTKNIISIEENKNYITIHFQRFYWEQKVSYLLNKINEFNNQQAINYEIKEFKESLVLQIVNNHIDSIKWINTMINCL